MYAFGCLSQMAACIFIQTHHLMVFTYIIYGYSKTLDPFLKTHGFFR